MAPTTNLDWEHWGNLPTIPPPPGVTPNFRNPVSLHGYDVVTQSVCLSITTLLIGMRIFTKGYVLHRLGWDDYTSILGWLGLIANAVLNLVEDHYGSGRHLWDVKGNDFTEYAKLINVSQIVYNPVILLVKTSIVLLFLRVFAPRLTVRIALHVILWSNCLFYTAGVFVEIFQCKPRIKIWLPLVPGTCINERAAQVTSGIFNTVSDLAILIVPIVSVWDLRLPPKKKWGLIATFGAGSLACIASLIRMIVIIQRSQHVTLDGTWEWYSLNLCSTAEITCGLICGCLPPIPAFVRFLRGKPPLSQVSKNPTKSSAPATITTRTWNERRNDTWEELAMVK